MSNPEPSQVYPPPTVIDVPPDREYPALKELAGLAVGAGMAVGGAVYRRMATAVGGVGAVMEWAARGPAGRIARDLLRSVATETGGDARSELAVAGRQAEEQLARIVAVVVPVVLDSLDVEEVVERIDVNGLMERVDVDAILDRIDVNALLARVDIDALVAGVELDEVLARVDVDAVMARVDVDALLARVDVEALMARAKIGEIVAESTGAFADSALDLGRRQVVGLDTIAMRLVNRALGRKPDDMPAGPPLLVDGEDGT